MWNGGSKFLFRGRGLKGLVFEVTRTRISFVPFHSLFTFGITSRVTPPLRRFRAPVLAALLYEPTQERLGSSVESSWAPSVSFPGVNLLPSAWICDKTNSTLAAQNPAFHYIVRRNSQPAFSNPSVRSLVEEPPPPQQLAVPELEIPSLPSLMRLVPPFVLLRVPRGVPVRQAPAGPAPRRPHRPQARAQSPPCER